MLESIYVSNLALIRSLCVDLKEGFSVITGQTGAGKSLVLKALTLFLEKGGAELVRRDTEGLRVELFFSSISKEHKDALSEHLSEEEMEEGITLSRQIASSGKSSCKICGRTVPFSLLSEIAGILLSVQGQFSSGGLLEEKNHRAALDGALSDEGKKALGEYRALYEDYASNKSRLEKLLSLGDERDELALIEFQMQEIAKVKPKVGEEEALEKKLASLQNVEKTHAALSTADRALSGGERGRGAVFLLEAAAQRLESLGEEDPSFAFSGELYEAARRVKEIAGEVSFRLSEISEEDPGDLADRIRKRLDAYYKLKLKYGQSAEEIIAHYEALKEKKDLTQGRKDDIKRTKVLVERLEKELSEAAKKLSEERKKKAVSLEREIHEILRFLDMEKTRFAVEFTPTDYTQNGNEAVRFLLAANSGEGLHPLSKVASGGELSRVMLALNLKLRSGVLADTLVFDEVDTGISGSTAQKIGIALKKLSLDRQILCVTHSAQVSTLASEHFLVEKTETDGRTETKVTALSEEEAAKENARLFAGATLTDEAVSAAWNLKAEGEKEFEKWKDTVL